MGLFNRRKDESFFELLTEIAGNLITGTNILSRLVKSDLDQRDGLRDELHVVENHSDDLTHAFMNKVNQSFITPLDRDDMSQIAYRLDDCMDLTDEAATLIVVYQVDTLTEDILKQVEILEKCAELTAEAMPRLKTLSELKEYWVEINRLENQADRIYMRALSAIVNQISDPIQVIKLKDITERLEEACDAYERLAALVEGIAIKES
ncbi:MAG: DUF47 family protein [Mobiluncus porci]|uniref:DUF47 domain-containing protein n=1 Tax=Mobiluncus porci TaxID=2652278 RepID=UPI0023F11ACC|nr:DUF47 family protein [Mobiluncus porci]MDD7542461.1 DUF47 family protein [Mobiluncus porci]MDY5747881.1 DUF47 family protein [Mobiluncus porci]